MAAESAASFFVISVEEAEAKGCDEFEASLEYRVRLCRRKPTK